MYILHVHIKVRPECVDAFMAATRANAEATRKEAGVIRFDLGQQLDDPTRFVLVEEYKSQEGHAAHRETKHYATWRDTVAVMMAEPRTATKYAPV